jgi:predicted Zn-dependent peptidase
MQRYGSQAMLFGLDETYGLGYRHSLEVSALIKAITAQDIQKAAQKFLTPETATLSIVDNGSVDEEKVRAAWKRTAASQPRKVRPESGGAEAVGHR